MASNGIEGAETVFAVLPATTSQTCLNPILVSYIKDPWLTIQISAIVFTFLISVCLLPGFQMITLVKSEQLLFPSGHPRIVLVQQLLAYMFVLNSLLLVLIIQSFVGMLLSVRLISKWKKKLEEEEGQSQELDEHGDSFLGDVQLVRYGALGASVMALICLLLTVILMCWVSMEASLFPSGSAGTLELEESSNMALGNRIEALLLVVAVILLAFVNGPIPVFMFLSKWVKERERIHL